MEGSSFSSFLQDLLRPFVRNGTLDLAVQASLLVCALVGFGLTSWLFRQEPKKEHAGKRSDARAAGAPQAAKAAAARDLAGDGDGFEGAEELQKKLAKAKKPKKGKDSRDEEVEEQLVAASSEPPAAPAAPVDSKPAGETPLLAFAGGRFGGAAFVDLRSPPHSFSGVSGGAMSISFVARWDALNTWSRIVDFGCGPACDNVTIANFEKGKTLVADIYRGTSRKRLLMTTAITVGETHRYLFTVSSSGRMRMLRDGSLLGELAGGYAPREVERTQMYVGGSSWAADGIFQGCIVNLCIWRDVVEWSTAFPPSSAGLQDVDGGLALVAANMPSAAASATAAAARQSEEAASATGVKDTEEERNERVAKLMAKKAERKARKAREKSEEAEAPAEEATATAEEVPEAAEEVAEAAPAEVAQEEEAEEEAAAAAAEEAEEAEEAEAEEREEEQPEERQEEEREEEREEEQPEEQEEEGPPEAEPELPPERPPATSRAREMSTAKQAAPWRRGQEKSAAWADLTEASEEAAEADFGVPDFAPEPEFCGEDTPQADQVQEVRAPLEEEEQEAAPPATCAEEPAVVAKEPAVQASPESGKKKKNKRGPSAAALAAAELRAELASERPDPEPASEVPAPGSLGEEEPPSQAAPADVPEPNDDDFEAAASSRRRGGRGRGAGKDGRTGRAAPAAPEPAGVPEAVARGAPEATAPTVEAVEAPAPGPAVASSARVPGVPPRAAAAPPARAAPVALSEEAGTRTALEREILKWEKKMREVERLRQRLADGEALEPLQQAKLARSGDIEHRLSELHAQQAEEQAMAVQTEELRPPQAPVQAEFRPPQVEQPMMQLIPPGAFPFGGDFGQMAMPLPMAPMPPVANLPQLEGRTPLRAPPPGKDQWKPSGGGASFRQGLPLQWAAVQGPEGFGAPMPGPMPGPEGVQTFDGTGGPGPPGPEQAFVPVGMYGGYPGGMPPPDQQDGGVAIEGVFHPVGQAPFPAPPGGCQGEPDLGLSPAGPGMALGPGMAPGPGMDGATMQLSPEGVPMELMMPPDVQMQDRWECCWEWVQTGWCPRGLTCRWEHPPLQPMGYAIYDQQAG